MGTVYGAPPPPVAPPGVAPRPPKVTTEAIASEVICPSCQMPTMIAPGHASVCFSCGQPLTVKRVPSGPEGFGLTGALPSRLVPPANPYGPSPSPRTPRLVGAGGEFTIPPTGELAAGRDPGRCAIVLGEARVSAVHAHLKLDGGALLVKDEGSNNGTFIDGERIVAGRWIAVPEGAELRFGPMAFKVTS